MADDRVSEPHGNRPKASPNLEPAAAEAVKKDANALIGDLGRVRAILDGVERDESFTDEAWLVESLREHFGLLALLAGSSRDEAPTRLRAVGVAAEEERQILALLDEHPHARRHLMGALARLARVINPWRNLTQRVDVDLDRGQPQAQVTIWGRDGSQLWHFREDLDDLLRLSGALARVVAIGLDACPEARISQDALDGLDTFLQALEETTAEVRSKINRLKQARSAATRVSEPAGQP